MGIQLKNVSIALGVATVLFGGYYLYIDSASSQLQSADSEQSLQNMLANTSVFIAYSQELEQINLELSLFEDQRFRSLRLYTDPIEDQPSGRENPFSESNQ
jgi:hypothetical protein